MGVVIGLEGIKIEKVKVKAVLDWPVPKLVKDIQRFLGLANYYRRFVKGFAEIVRLCVRRGSHRGRSPQNGLRDERTCGTTLASAYVLRRLSAAWSQLQMKERESE